jgi:hypothetical protein
LAIQPFVFVDQFLLVLLLVLLEVFSRLTDVNDMQRYRRESGCLTKWPKIYRKSIKLLSMRGGSPLSSSAAP